MIYINFIQIYFVYIRFLFFTFFNFRPFNVVITLLINKGSSMSLIVIGHSGSGKTTWSKKFCQENNYEYVDVDLYMDEICERYGWKQLPVTESSKLSDQYKVAICMQALSEHQGKNCVFDGIYFLSLPIAILKAYQIVIVNPSHDVIIEQRRNRCKNHPRGKFKNLSDEQIDDLAKAMIVKYDSQIKDLIPYADDIVV